KLACPICLGCHPHQIHECNNPNLWDGSPTHARCTTEGHIIDSKGYILCSNWQKPNSCSLSHKSAKHECSRCGSCEHGAQQCHHAHKHTSTNPIQA
ncbi:hypothetical protein F5J12DRAFT_723075, partial [Pisolithus orientalis]|uniref:uncharacterized protein n=1 Tax=Pisolithus orientalis TaxID=936130 RepID=UPI0022245606